MRRITIYTDEASAQKAVGWLEQEGFDFMSEDYAEPTLQRRPQPIRRDAPERHEASGGFLPPTRMPSLKPKRGRRRGALADGLLYIIREEGSILKERLQTIAAEKGWPWKQCADTLRRLVAARMIGADRDGYWKV